MFVISKFRLRAFNCLIPYLLFGRNLLRRTHSVNSALSNIKKLGIFFLVVQKKAGVGCTWVGQKVSVQRGTSSRIRIYMHMRIFMYAQANVRAEKT